MRDDGQGLDSDVGEPWATNGGARLQFAGIAKSDALTRANLNVSDEPDTSMPSHQRTISRAQRSRQIAPHINAGDQ